MWIQGFDQGNLLASTPAFELLLAVDGRPHIVKRLPIEPAIYIVFTGKTGKDVFFVLEHAILRAPGDADVEGSRQAAHNVDEMAFSLAHLKPSHVLQETQAMLRSE